VTRDTPTLSSSGHRSGASVRLPVVAFDGDDTLWHNESIFSTTQEKYRELLRNYVVDGDLDRRLFDTETRNLRLFGYGVKGFTLSMIETAIEVSGGRISGSAIQNILDQGKAMIDHPVELLEGARASIERLSDEYQVMLITKGDLFDQEGKIARSGLADLFWKVEIVSEKDEQTYRRILTTYGIDPSDFIMVGNSVRSDILPVLAIGGRAVHVPYHLTWAHERAEIEPSVDSAWVIESIGQLPELLDSIRAQE
jgi:putative hydrolase of the HAD superfamily